MRDEIILLLAYPDTEGKMNILRDLVKEIRSSVSLPVALASHLPIPGDILGQLDYFIYDKNDLPAVNYFCYYHYNTPGLSLKSKRLLPYHGLSCYSSIKNGATFLRNKFRYAHFLEYDTILNLPVYLAVVNPRFEQFKFIGREYEVPKQSLHGINTTNFSFDIGWLDDNLPEISSWEEYKTYARDTKDNVLFESWMHNYFTDNNMMPSCYFMSPKEIKRCILHDNIQVRGCSEPGLRAYLSELEDHRLILFFHRYGAGFLDIDVDHNGYIDHMYWDTGAVYWRVIDKKGYITVSSKEQSYEFFIDPNKEYTDTRFRFDDGKLKCLREME